MTYAVEKVYRDGGLSNSNYGEIQLRCLRQNASRTERKERDSCQTRGQCSLKCSKLDDGVVDAARCCTYPSGSARTHDQCSRRARTSETRCIEARSGGPGKCSGLAAVSQQSRSTTWSLTRRLKHSAAGRASTWYVWQNMSSRRLACYFGCGMRSKQDGPSVLRCLTGQRHEVADERVPKRQA